ncbi:hypothetical protein [Microcoleus sp. Pol10D4]|uniref:hypothetical protein n=1 Tax=Microcoleus sp. Pol10D4 TaxID=3055387 RepID=UPI002FD4C555
MVDIGRFTRPLYLKRVCQAIVPILRRSSCHSGDRPHHSRSRTSVQAQNIHNLIYTVTLPDFDATDEIPLPL